MDFIPDSITIGGKAVSRRKELTEQGYTFDDSTHVLYIRHTSSRDVDIQGKSDRVPPYYITFDDPHLPAGTPLIGQYPSGVIDWGKGDWEIGTPHGKFATFTLVLADPKARQADFHFTCRSFFPVSMSTTMETRKRRSLFVRPKSETSFSIKPKELRRLIPRGATQASGDVRGHQREGLRLTIWPISS